MAGNLHAYVGEYRGYYEAEAMGYSSIFCLSTRLLFVARI